MEENKNEEVNNSIDGKPPVLKTIPYSSKKEEKKLEKFKRQEAKKIHKSALRDAKKRHKGYSKHQSIQRYDTNPQYGLPLDLVDERIMDGLINVNNVKTSKSYPRIFFSNIVTVFNILIFLIAGILISVNAFTDLVFFGLVLINITIGIYQEIRAKHTIDKLSLLSAPTAIVKRGGVDREISVNDIVLDDLLMLETGKQICTDSIVVEGQIEVNESLLTGESDAILKKPGDVLYAGSYIVSGKCSARVDKVGKDNFIEKLSSQAKRYKKPKSDLLFSLNWIIKVMGTLVVVLGFLLFYTMFYKNKLDYVYSIRKTAGAMIGMIPSGLFLMTSIALAVGVIRLGQRNVLVQELYCIEMLARVNCICLDKTGTITDGTMNVKNVIEYNTISGLTTKNIISAILNAIQDTNLTSKALEQRFGLGKRIKHLALIPFSSSRKYQAVTFDKYGTFILGAPEFVLKEEFNLIKKDVDKYAAQGYRVLCLAHKEGIIENNQLPETEISVVSLILIEDNIRPDAINTIKYFKESGVEVKVISGDNPITVSKISQRAGISHADEYISLDGLTEQEVINAATKYTVFGRVSPAQKKLIIETLKENGMTVAMTGDGVNDILALKEADCSIAVASGSEAARNVSHLVLLDSNFDSMPSVVAEGRRVINNISSVASLFLTKTIFSLFLAIQALQTGTYPISTNQLILIDTLCIGLPSLFLIMEPNNNPVRGKFLSNVIKKALPGAFVILIISIITFTFGDFDAITLSTVIVIAATHTCMMVLFKACKPFNSLRRALCTVCYSLFLFAITVMPSFLEIRPVASFAEYYSSSITFPDMVSSYPSLEISKDNYYIINGKVTDIYKNPLTTNENLISCAKGSVDDDTNESSHTYYTIGGKLTKTRVYVPSVSFAQNGDIYLTGMKLNNVRYYDGIENDIVVKSNGELYLNNKPIKIDINKDSDFYSNYYNFHSKYGQSDVKTVTYKIMPTLESKGGVLTINGEQQQDYQYKLPSNVSSIDDADITIDENLNLLINGKALYPIDSKGNVIEEPFKVTIPTITTDLDNVYLCPSTNDPLHNLLEFYGSETKETFDEDETLVYYSFEDKKLKYCKTTKKFYYNDKLATLKFNDIILNGFTNVTVTNEDGTYNISLDNIDTLPSVNVVAGSNKYSLEIPSKTPLEDMILGNIYFGPVIDCTKSGMYIIDGYYTDYEATNESPDPHMDADHNLILGGVTTDYVISANNIIKKDTGIVTALDKKSIIFLLMLCLLASPLMRIVPNVIPWIKKQVKVIQRLLTKY